MNTKSAHLLKKKLMLLFKMFPSIYAILSNLTKVNLFTQITSVIIEYLIDSLSQKINESKIKVLFEKVLWNTR